MTTAEEITARAREIMAQDLPEDYNPELRDDEPLIVEGGIDDEEDTGPSGHCEMCVG